jgi:predicted nucleic acid-binding protein
MKDKIFIDTNIVVYAHLKQPTEIAKWEIAFELIRNNKFVMSTQALSEYYASLLKNKVDDKIIQENIGLLIKNHEICLITIPIIQLTHQIKLKYRVYYWDSLILATALENQCTQLYSEDMQHKQIIEERLQIINPFSSIQT